MKMATEFDLESPEVVSGLKKGDLKAGKNAPSFDPMRRKLKIHIED